MTFVEAVALKDEIERHQWYRVHHLWLVAFSRPEQWRMTVVYQPLRPNGLPLGRRKAIHGLGSPDAWQQFRAVCEQKAEAAHE